MDVEMDHKSTELVSQMFRLLFLPNEVRELLLLVNLGFKSKRIIDLLETYDLTNHKEQTRAVEEVSKLEKLIHSGFTVAQVAEAIDELKALEELQKLSIFIELGFTVNQVNEWVVKEPIKITNFSLDKPINEIPKIPILNNLGLTQQQVLDAMNELKTVQDVLKLRWLLDLGFTINELKELVVKEPKKIISFSLTKPIDEVSKLMDLIDLGFTRDQVLEAMHELKTVEEALKLRWLLNLGFTINQINELVVKEPKKILSFSLTKPIDEVPKLLNLIDLGFTRDQILEAMHELKAVEEVLKLNWLMELQFTINQTNESINEKKTFRFLKLLAHLNKGNQILSNI